MTIENALVDPHDARPCTEANPHVPLAPLLGQFLFWRMRYPPAPQCIEEQHKRNAAKHGHHNKIGEDGQGHDGDEPESSSHAVPTPPPSEVSLSSWWASRHMSGRPHQLVDSTPHPHQLKGTTKATGSTTTREATPVMSESGAAQRPRGNRRRRRYRPERRPAGPMRSGTCCSPRIGWRSAVS